MFEKITDTIYAITDGSTVGNVGMIATENGNFVIDTSMYPVMARDIRQTVNRTRTGRLGASIFTHYHFDHTAGNQHFSDVPMYAHRILQNNFMTNYKDKEEEITTNFAKREKDGHLFEGLEVTPMNRVFESDSLVADEDPGIELIHVGGHTTGSTVIYYQPENVLFAGDNIFAGHFPGGHDPSSDPYQWKQALVRMRELDPSIVIPGHGTVHEGLSEIDKLSSYITSFIEKGEKLAADLVELEQAAVELAEIEFYDELFPGMKDRTVKNWFSKVEERISES